MKVSVTTQGEGTDSESVVGKRRMVLWGFTRQTDGGESGGYLSVTPQARREGPRTAPLKLFCIRFRRDACRSNGSKIQGG